MEKVQNVGTKSAFTPILIPPLATSAFAVSWGRKEPKCQALIGLETKSGEMKMQGPKWKKYKMQKLKVHLRHESFVKKRGLWVP